MSLGTPIAGWQTKIAFTFTDDGRSPAFWWLNHYEYWEVYYQHPSTNDLDFITVD